MPTKVASRRPVRRCTLESNREKMVLNIDLNDHPVEGQEPAGTSGSVHLRTLQGAATLANMRAHHHSRRQPSSTAQPPQPVSQPSLMSGGVPVVPIDVEAIDDEVEMLSSSAGFPQARNNSRRNRRRAVVIDVEVGSNTGPSGVNVEDSVSSSGAHTHRRDTIQLNGTVINCEAGAGLADAPSSKRKKVTPEPAKVVFKEPTFTCPICMNKLVDAWSTICGHIFCQKCIKSAIKIQKKCPTCRRKLTPSNVHKVFLPAAD